MKHSILDSLLQIRIGGKSPVGIFLRFNEWGWNQLPTALTRLRPIRSYGRFLHAMVRRRTDRRQYFGTFFFRNRPQLELIRRLSFQAEIGSILNIAVLGCSNGAEVYSILATLRLTRPELKVAMHAVDISKDILEIAQRGNYSLRCPELVGERIFQRINETEILKMFQRNQDQVIVQPWVKEGTTWHHGDIRDPKILELLGPQEIVVANNFLCHMRPTDAENCLLTISRFVRPGGYLVVSGIDLDVRAKVATDQKWKPVTELLEDVHDGDVSVRRDWPSQYWGLEPLDKTRKDWVVRYASTFQVGEQVASAGNDSFKGRQQEHANNFAGLKVRSDSND